MACLYIFWSSPYNALIWSCFAFTVKEHQRDWFGVWVETEPPVFLLKQISNIMKTCSQLCLTSRQVFCGPKMFTVPPRTDLEHFVLWDTFETEIRLLLLACSLWTFPQTPNMTSGPYQRNDRSCSTNQLVHQTIFCDSIPIVTVRWYDEITFTVHYMLYTMVSLYNTKEITTKS
ncbi:hypothetical protein M378DRAFT_386405 [Amanita muscaria Koide BX008]|uniref:Uncharacterized protein n=1 Tax=Amanita muscaria (strain Koide BX008) TaxID=946122 RepID=A0A0C2WX07_AMAMK|nr:hypothetical protein M378DRAFT_386405 [Amanita muscaria Koide BX008]